MTSRPGFQGCDPGFPGNLGERLTDNIYRRGCRPNSKFRTNRPHAVSSFAALFFFQLTFIREVISREGIHGFAGITAYPYMAHHLLPGQPTQEALRSIPEPIATLLRHIILQERCLSNGRTSDAVSSTKIVHRTIPTCESLPKGP